MLLNFFLFYLALRREQAKEIAGNVGSYPFCFVEHFALLVEQFCFGPFPVLGGSRYPGYLMYNRLFNSEKGIMFIFVYICSRSGNFSSFLLVFSLSVPIGL